MGKSLLLSPYTTLPPMAKAGTLYPNPLPVCVCLHAFACVHVCVCVCVCVRYGRSANDSVGTNESRRWTSRTDSQNKRIDSSIPFFFIFLFQFSKTWLFIAFNIKQKYGHVNKRYKRTELWFPSTVYWYIESKTFSTFQPMRAGCNRVNRVKTPEIPCQITQQTIWLNESNKQIKWTICYSDRNWNNWFPEKNHFAHA